MSPAINRCTIFLLSILVCIGAKGQDIKNNIKIHEGILIYFNDDSTGYTPQEVLFIPHRINKNRRLKANVLAALRSKKIATHLIFLPMRHTQRFILDKLNEFSEPIDTTQSIISKNLEYSCMLMPKIELKAVFYPYAGEISGKINIKAVAGIIAEKPLESIDRKQRQEQSSTPKTAATKLKYHCKSFDLTYIDDRLSFGSLYFFLPFKL